MLLAGLGAGAVGIAAAGTPILGLGRMASGRDRAFLSLQGAGLAEWRSVVGETFSLVSPGGSRALRVVAVKAFPASGLRPRSLGRSEAFSVLFEAAGGPPLPDGDRLYQLAHRSLPSLPILMGSPTSVGRKARLIAVFN